MLSSCDANHLWTWTGFTCSFLYLLSQTAARCQLSNLTAAWNNASFSFSFSFEYPGVWLEVILHVKRSWYNSLYWKFAQQLAGTYVNTFLWSLDVNRYVSRTQHSSCVPILSHDTRQAWLNLSSTSPNTASTSGSALLSTVLNNQKRHGKIRDLSILVMTLAKIDWSCQAHPNISIVMSLIQYTMNSGCSALDCCK